MNSKEELLALYNDAKSILSYEIIGYLNELINLNISVFQKDVISPKQQKLLSELDIYRKCAKYNIYNRVINLMCEDNKNIKISDNSNKLNINSSDFGSIIDFDYSSNNAIGSITIYDNIFDSEAYKKAYVDCLINMYTLGLEKELITNARVYDDECRKLNICPILCNELFRKNNKEQIVKQLEAKLKQSELMFDSMKNSKTNDSEIINISNYFYALLANEFQIEQENKESGKKLVKKIPGLTITKDVKPIIY